MKNIQSGKVAAVSGATGSIGKAIAAQLAMLNFTVVLIARDSERCSQVAEDIIAETKNRAVEYRIADLSRKSSIQKLVDSWRGPLHVLINNAAVAPQTRKETQEGIELQFATNVLDYFWMSNEFADILADSSPSRIINVASYWAGGLDLNDLEFIQRPYHNHDAYRQSKQANRMITPISSRLLEKRGVFVNSCHPGDVKSTLSNNLGFGGSQSAAEGAKTPVWLATSKSLEGVSGRYFENRKEAHCQFGSQTEDAERLYEICASY